MIPIDAHPYLTTEILENYSKKGTEDGEFTKDQLVKERMALLCGATNFSLAMRNSEHAARYIKIFIVLITFIV